MSNKTFFRNTDTIYTDDGEVIDSDSLWEQKEQNLLVLVDDDRYIEHKLTMNFIEVE